MPIIFEHIKIPNPVEKVKMIEENAEMYSGDINNYKFYTNHYTNRFNTIQNILPNDMKLKIIYASKKKRSGEYNGNYTGNKGTYCEFVACSDYNNFIWKRYDSYTCCGGSSDDVYIKGVKYKTTYLLSNPNILQQ